MLLLLILYNYCVEQITRLKNTKSMIHFEDTIPEAIIPTPFTNMIRKIYRLSMFEMRLNRSSQFLGIINIETRTDGYYLNRPDLHNRLTSARSPRLVLFTTYISRFPGGRIWTLGYSSRRARTVKRQNGDVKYWGNLTLTLILSQRGRGDE